MFIIGDVVEVVTPSFLEVVNKEHPVGCLRTIGKDYGDGSYSVSTWVDGRSNREYIFLLKECNIKLAKSPKSIDEFL